MTTNISPPSVEVQSSRKGLLSYTVDGILRINNYVTSFSGVYESAISSDGTLIAAVTVKKEIVILQQNADSGQWQSVFTHRIPKRATSIQFSPDDKSLVFADAFGDVYGVPVDKDVNLFDDEKQEEYRLLGHFSTITDIAISSHYNLIATADRDNRIRISRLQQMYVIEAFCLGHTDFITSLVWVNNGKTLVSAANDGTLKAWDSYTGKLIDSLDVSTHKFCKMDHSNAESATEPAIAQLQVLGEKMDLLSFILFSSRYIFTVSTHPCGKFHEIKCSVTLDKDDLITAITKSNGGERLLVSVKTNTTKKSIRYFKLKSDPNDIKSVNLLEIEIDKDLGLSNDESLSNSYNDNGEHLSFLRMDWLKRQKKKEMVTNWKGKKRRHVEI